MSQLSTNKQRYTLIPTPFDSKRTNCYVDGSNIVIETIPEYLARIPADIRDTFIVTVMLPKVGHSAGTFPIATFSTVLADFDFKLYGFVGGLADINFVELDFSTVESFLDLTDTPDSYTGEANKFVRVKNDESGLEFITIETNSITVTVNQPLHGLSVGYPIRVSGTNTYIGAQADSEANAEVVGYVTEIVDGDNFKYVPIGEVTTGVPAVVAGTVLFLSPIVQGGLTSTEPTTVGQVSKPLMVVIESGARALFINYRGMKITTATQGDIIDAENLGTGEGIFANKDVDTLQFKSLVEGTNITLSSDGNEIIINATDTGEANTASNLGTGEGIYAQKVGVDLQFKSLKEGTNVTISADANEITINSTATTNDVVAGDGMNFTTNDPVTLGTPSTVDGNSTNSVITNSHTHELGDVPTSKLTGTIPATSVSFTPAGNISLTNVQSAIEELDTEKQAMLVSGTNIKTINGSSILGSGDLTVSGGTSGIWTSLTGSYASAVTFTFIGTDTDVKLITLSLLTCTDTAGTTRRIGYVKSAVNNSGTITATVVTNSDLASGDKDFKVTYNRKVTDYQRLVTIPGECTADISYSQGMFYADIMSDSYLLPVDTSVLTAAAGAGAALTYNVYKNTTNLFSSAPDMTTNTVLRAQRPTTNTITAGETVSLRIMSSAGATNKAADFQAKLFIIPQAIWVAF